MLRIADRPSETGDLHRRETLEFRPDSIRRVDDQRRQPLIKFSNMGGYAYSYSYVEYLDKIYGWDRVIAYASGEEDYQQAFGKSEREIYAEWGDYIQQQD